MSLPSISVKRPITTFMVFAAIIVIGIFSLRQIPIDLLPDISYPAMAVITDYEGAAPEEVERMVTEPIERMVSTVNNIKEVSSISYEGRSLVLINFTWGTDMDAAANDVREKIALAERMLPDEAEKPLVFKFDPSLMPVEILSLSGNLPLERLRRLAEDRVKYELEQIEGVASVSVSGGREREIQVLVDRDKLESVGLSIGQLVRILQAENINLPAGYMETEDQELLIRGMGEFRSVEQIKNVVICGRGGPVYLKDVAEVRDSFKEKRGEVLVNGREAVILSVFKESGANTVRVSEGVRQRLSSIGKLLPPSVEIDTIIDTSEYIRDSISNLQQTAIQGAAIAMVVVFLFLANLPSTLIISFAIPVSVLVAFILLRLAGLTLNIMTLGGLAIGVGMMVDNAIVILENIFRHRQRGEPAQRAAVMGSNEMGMAVTASTLTTLVVFISLLFVSGIVGILFKHIAYTVIFSLSASLLVALTLIPMLSSKYLSAKTLERKKRRRFSRKLNEYMESRYGFILDWALAHKKVVILGSVSILGATLLLLPRIGSEFIPQTDQGVINISVETPTGTKWRITEKVAKKVEEVIRESVPELDKTLIQVGSGGGVIGFAMGTGSNNMGTGSNNASLTVSLVERSQRKRSTMEITDLLRSRLADISGAKITFSEASAAQEIFTGTPVVIEVRGYDLEEGKRLARRIADLIGKIRGVVEPRVSYKEGMPELRVNVDRDKASSLGLNFFQIADAVKAANEGKVATYFREAGSQYDIRVRLNRKDLQKPSDIGKILITSPSGRQISLDTVAHIERASGPVNIERKEQQRVITISAGISGRDLGSIDREIREKLSKLKIPEGFSVEVAGQQKEMAESFRSLLGALILAVILVYMVMASQFESLRHPFVIMFSVPFALIGVIWILFLSRTTISAVVYMGLIMLVGIVVNNGIVMISYINILREKGMSALEATRTGARRRLRPILMTTFTTVFALIPMALGWGAGAELWAPMARTVIGGLSVSMIFTLILVPTLYTIFAGKKR